MKINQSTATPNFEAKFFHSKSLEDIANFAVRTNAFGKLNRMQSHISKKYLKIRIKVDVNVTEQGLAQVTFSRYYPKRDAFVPKSLNDYRKANVVTYTSTKPVNPLWFAMNKIIEMGDNATNNDIFKEVVVKK